MCRPFELVSNVSGVSSDLRQAMEAAIPRMDRADISTDVAVEHMRALDRVCMEVKASMNHSLHVVREEGATPWSAASHTWERVCRCVPLHVWKGDHAGEATSETVLFACRVAVHRAVRNGIADPDDVMSNLSSRQVTRWAKRDLSDDGCSLCELPPSVLHTAWRDNATSSGASSQDDSAESRTSAASTHNRTEEDQVEKGVECDSLASVFVRKKRALHAAIGAVSQAMRDGGRLVDTKQ